MAANATRDAAFAQHLIADRLTERQFMVMGSYHARKVAFWMIIAATPALPQDAPTFDGSQLRQQVLQLEYIAEDLNVQLEQLATKKREVETQISQLSSLEAQLTALVE